MEFVPINRIDRISLCQMEKLKESQISVQNWEKGGPVHCEQVQCNCSGFNHV